MPGSASWPSRWWSLPPLVEEIIFRGFLLERWSVKWRVGVAVIVQAVAFGILHVDPVGAGVFGVVMALMYLRSGSLWSRSMHAINNGTVLLAVIAGAGAVPIRPRRHRQPRLPSWE